MRSLCLGDTALFTPTNLLAMFVTGGTFHPAALGYSVEKKARKIQRQKRCESPTHKKSIDRSDSWSCQVQLIMALQGIETDATARHLVASTINNLDSAEKANLIEFLEKIGIPAAMENNACKAFACTTHELENVLNEDNIDALTKLWKLTQTQIIPTLEAMLYPLKVFDGTFNVRKVILTSFRDRVLARVLLTIRGPLPTLQSMIFYISLSTSDDTTEFATFNKLADRALGIAKEESPESKNSAEADDEVCRLIRPKSRAKPRLSEPVFFTTPKMPKKKRSTTLPTRSVHWADLEPSIRKISLN